MPAEANPAGETRGSSLPEIPDPPIAALDDDEELFADPAAPRPWGKRQIADWCGHPQCGGD
jgi:hypothetical protein